MMADDDGQGVAEGMVVSIEPYGCTHTLGLFAPPAQAGCRFAVATE
jgi:hypothetical protein